MTGKRTCATPRCPSIIERDQSHCPKCKAEYAAERGTRQQRGYGVAHQRERARWTPQVAAGLIICWRCRRRIIPGTPWDLGHADDRLTWRGPEHPACNRAAAGRSAH